MTMGATELARKLKISRERIYQLDREGRISREPDGKFDINKVRISLSRKSDISQRVRSRKPDSAGHEADPVEDLKGGSTYELFNRARAVKEMAIAKEKQLDLRLRQEELIERSELAAVLTDKITAFSNRLLLVPDKIAPKVAAIKNVLECRAIIEHEIREVIKALGEIANAA